MNQENREVLESVKRKYFEAKRPTDKIVVKWLGWLAIFLSMNTEARIEFASNEDEVNLTKKQLTKDLYGIRYKDRRQKVRPTSNNRAV